MAVLSTVHALIGAYDPTALNWLDPKFVGIMASLRYLGLDCSSPGLTGPLIQQFYTNQVGLAAWGVVFATISTTVQVFRGTLILANPDAAIQKRIREKGISAKEAEWQAHSTIVFLLVPAIILFLVLFLNGVRGWTPFHIRASDWIILMIFSWGMIFLSGALVPLLIAGTFIWLRRDICKLLRANV